MYEYWTPPIDVTDPDFELPPGGFEAVYADTSPALNAWNPTTYNEYINRIWRLTPRLGSDPTNADAQRNARLGLMSRAQIRPEEAMAAYNEIASPGMYGIPGGPIVEAQTIRQLEALGWRPSHQYGPPTIYMVAPPEPGSGELWTITKKVYDPVAKEWTTTVEEVPADPRLLGMDLRPGMNVRYERPPGQPGAGEGYTGTATPSEGYIQLPFEGQSGDEVYYHPETGQVYVLHDGTYLAAPGWQSRVGTDEQGLYYTDPESGLSMRYDPESDSWQPGGPGGAAQLAPTRNLPGYPARGPGQLVTPIDATGQPARDFGGDIDFIGDPGFTLEPTAGNQLDYTSAPSPYGQPPPPMAMYKPSFRNSWLEQRGLPRLGQWPPAVPWGQES